MSRTRDPVETHSTFYVQDIVLSCSCNTPYVQCLGHVAYVGMLFVDYTHNHPVLRVFCRELKGAASDRRPMSTNQDLDTGASNGYGSFDSDHSPTVTGKSESVSPVCVLFTRTSN